MGETLELLRAAVRPGVTHPGARHPRGDQHPRPRRRPVVQGLQPPAVPGDDLRLGQRRGGARHPRARARSPRVTSSRSTAAPSSRAGTATPRSRSPSARSPTTSSSCCGSPRSRCGAAWQPPASAVGSATSATPSRPTSARRAATASSRTTPATASAPRCTCRPTCPTYGRRGRGPAIVEGLALAVEPMVTLGSKHTDLLEDEWTVATVDGSCAAHFEHTFTVTPQGAWVLTAVDGGRGPPRRPRRPIRRTLTLDFAPTPATRGRLTRLEGSIPRQWCRQYGVRASGARCHWFAASGASGRDLRRPCAARTPISPSSQGATAWTSPPGSGSPPSPSPSRSSPSTWPSSAAGRTSRA